MATRFVAMVICLHGNIYKILHGDHATHKISIVFNNMSDENHEKI
jgi:hypothetical protein